MPPPLRSLLEALIATSGATDYGEVDVVRILEILIPSLITLVTGLLGLWFLLRQVRLQHHSSLELQRENLRNEQRIGLFDSLNEKLKAAEEALSAASAWGTMLPTMLRLRIHHGDRIPLNFKSMELQALQATASARIGDVIGAIERREVIHPAFYLFRIAVARQSERWMVAMQAVQNVVTPLVPIDPPPDLAATGIRPRAVRQPRPDDLAGVQGALERARDESTTLSAFLGDVSREAQNQLLGPLFEQSVPERKPLDPHALVLSISPESVTKAEEKLGLAPLLHPEALPSSVLSSAARKPRFTGWRRG
jgi:hypothetical protein